MTFLILLMKKKLAHLLGDNKFLEELNFASAHENSTLHNCASIGVKSRNVATETTCMYSKET